MKAAFNRLIKRFITRHPILFYIRFILLSKNLGDQNLDDVGRYDLTNKREDIPQIFKDYNPKINIVSTDTTVEKVSKIASFLQRHSRPGPAICLSSSQTLELVLAGKGGVCNDYSMLFNVFCLLNNIPSKEWNCVEKFYNVIYGHTFNEIYCDESQKWIAVDVGKMLTFTKTDGRTPISALELFKGLRAGQPLCYKNLSAECDVNQERLRCVYSKTAIPYVTSNYNAVETDRYLEKLRVFPLFFIGAITVLLRKNCSFVFVLDDYKKLLTVRKSN